VLYKIIQKKQSWVEATKKLRKESVLKALSAKADQVLQKRKLQLKKLRKKFNLLCLTKKREAFFI